eukprot:Opistho-2@33305
MQGDRRHNSEDRQDSDGQAQKCQCGVTARRICAHRRYAGTATGCGGGAPPGSRPRAPAVVPPAPPGTGREGGRPHGRALSDWAHQTHVRVQPVACPPWDHVLFQVRGIGDFGEVRTRQTTTGATRASSAQRSSAGLARQSGLRGETQSSFGRVVRQDRSRRDCGGTNAAQSPQPRDRQHSFGGKLPQKHPRPSDSRYQTQSRPAQQSAVAAPSLRTRTGQEVLPACTFAPCAPQAGEKIRSQAEGSKDRPPQRRHWSARRVSWTLRTDPRCDVVQERAAENSAKANSRPQSPSWAQCSPVQRVDPSQTACRPSVGPAACL